MGKSQEPKRSALFLAIIFVALISSSKCDSVTTVTEGEVVKLEFPYPCDSDEVTIQIANRAPFYSSNDPDYLHLSYYRLYRFRVEEKNCSLQVEINRVKRVDEATYICKAYKDGVILELIRTRLNVDYPAGIVSCVPSDEDKVGEWVLLQCEVSVGSLPVEIFCYQNSKRLPPQTCQNALLPKNGGILTQNIWFTLEYPVFCCTSLLDQPKDMCDCHDFSWDPSNAESVLHPCPSSTPDNDSTTSTYQGENTEDHSFTETTTSSCSLSSTDTNKVNISPWLWSFVPISFLELILLLITTLCLYKASRQMKGKQPQKETLTETGEIQADHDCSSPSSQTTLVQD